MTTLPAQTSRSSLSLADFDPKTVTDEWLESLDIAQANLACAVGLPGAEDLDVEASLAKIDEWTEEVRRATAQNYPQFFGNPARFERSLAKYKIAILCRVLQRKCGVGYNPERRLHPSDCSDPKDRFIFGITHGAGGTCATLPVFYAAVGRRLGYPLKFIAYKTHCFLRWDDSDSLMAEESFNIETTGEGAIYSSDQYYIDWLADDADPVLSPPTSLECESRRTELATFLVERSRVFLQRGEYVKAIEPAAMARQLDPKAKYPLGMAIQFALGMLKDRPEWAEKEKTHWREGVVVPSCFWPREVDNPKLLPAARLSPFVLEQLFPPRPEKASITSTADMLYERIDYFKDEKFIAEVEQAAALEAAEIQSALMLREHEIRRFRLEQQYGFMNAQPQPPWQAMHEYPPQDVQPAAPGVAGQAPNPLHGMPPGFGPHMPPAPTQHPNGLPPHVPMPAFPQPFEPQSIPQPWPSQVQPPTIPPLPSFRSHLPGSRENDLLELEARLAAIPPPYLPLQELLDKWEKELSEKRLSNESKTLKPLPAE